jgi:hypothetical protein
MASSRSWWKNGEGGEREKGVRRGTDKRGGRGREGQEEGGRVSKGQR